MYPPYYKLFNELEMKSFANEMKTFELVLVTLTYRRQMVSIKIHRG